MQSTSDHLNITSALEILSMSDIIRSLPPGTFKYADKRSRARLHQAALTLTPGQHQILIKAAVSNSKKRKAPESRERMDTGPQYTPVQTSDPKRPKTRIEPEHPTDNDVDSFLETVSDKCRRERMVKFIEATGRDATKSVACAVCAGRFFNNEIRPVKITDLKNNGKLIPASNHPAHELTEGMLLHRGTDSVFNDESGTCYARTCDSCVNILARNKTPPLALANDMWIGDVPLPLRILTLPERILIARYFPATYIVKLYPKKKGARSWASTSSLHSALRGNVSTYRLNTDQIAALVGDCVMPPHPSILAATVGVTFVGPKNLPQKTMPGFLRVNRARIRMALAWLKDNNPVYSDIVISETRLNELPEDDVPAEIMSLAKHSDDTGLLAKEMDGYVPEDAGDDESGCCSVKL